MANFSDNFNKTIAKGFNTVGQLNTIGNALGIFERPNRPAGLAKRVHAELSKNGVAKTTLAYTQIVTPGVLTGFTKRTDTAFLSYRNDSFSTPGLSLATTDIRRYGVGPTEKKPYGVNYQDVTFNYILDTSQNQHKYFYKWMDGIVNHHTGRYFAEKNAQGMSAYQVNYKKNYATSIMVYSVDDRLDNDPNRQEVLIEDAYPIFIGDIQYNWAGTDTLIRLPVTFTYYRWEMRNLQDEGNLEVAPGAGLGLFGQLLKAGQAIQALSTLRSPRNIADVVNVVNVSKNF